MMRTSIYLVCAAVVVAVRSEDNHQLMNRYLEPVDVSVDPETVNYLLPKLAAKYRPNSDWKDVTDPRLYVLTEMESNDVDNQIDGANNLRRSRNKRDETWGSTRLSVLAPLFALRDAYNKELLNHQKIKNRAMINRLTSSSPY